MLELSASFISAPAVGRRSTAVDLVSGEKRNLMRCARSAHAVLAVCDSVPAIPQLLS